MRKEIELTISPEEYVNDSLLTRLISKKSNIDAKYLSYRILKSSLDSRKEIVYHLRVMVSSNGDLPSLRPKPFLNVKNSMPIIVVGAGPAGLAASLRLIQHGLKPIIIERGKPVEERKKDTTAILKNETINPNSNFCYGEGGAGAFSDGKLFSRSNKKGNIDEILQFFIYFGADERILYQAHPHIGTDVLSKIIKNMREQIISSGGEYRFNTCVEDIIEESGSAIGITTSDGEDIMADRVVLATGHSANEIYHLFDERHWAMEAKPFAMGVRIEHTQEMINTVQYHGKFDKKFLPPAEYGLTAQNGDRGIFTFCMCPGGIVVPTVERDGIMVVNGMSNSLRSGEFANSAIVVTINEQDAKDFDEYGALKLLKYQKYWEEKMFFSGSICPAQRATDFLADKVSSSLPKSSYMPSLQADNLLERLPNVVSENIKFGLQEFDKKIRGFASADALLIGLESRTSSPVRLLRDKVSLESLSVKHLYPIGEGSGYAGGITSSAMDGINVADRIADELEV